MHEIDLKSIEAKHMFQTTLFGFEEFLNRFPSDAFNSVAVKKNLQIKKNLVATTSLTVIITLD